MTDTVYVPMNRPNLQTRAERLAAGKALRERVPRESHAAWHPPAKRRDPVEVLKESNQDRLPELVPIRYGRMLASPFAFLRGSAGLMAADLAATPASGLQVQACGDCHLLNFGLFATPERNLIFDINDFDETLPAPWEWDVKRLAVSFVVAARDIHLSEQQAFAVAVECLQAYREQLREFSKLSPLDIWYFRRDAQTLIETAPTRTAKRRREEAISKAQRRIGEYLVPEISAEVDGRRRLIDRPPLLFHVDRARDPEHSALVQDAVEQYRLSLPDERRVLFDRYSLADVVVKAVGIGSVGTFCFAGLFLSSDEHPLLLQFKQACPSVLEPYAGKSIYGNHGQRVVTGQRLLQSASDIFLGWTRGRRGRDFFVRQLRDMKMSARIEEGASAKAAKQYARLCGETLAHAHAKSGDAALLSGYLGKADVFDQAAATFAVAYADQNEQDYQALVKSAQAGQIEALIEDES